jgi:dihydropteroate synthase
VVVSSLKFEICDSDRRFHLSRASPCHAIIDSMDLSHRAKIWQLRARTLDLPSRPLLMGIVNVTPDSFSDGGRLLDLSGATAHAEQLATDGADIIDVGGESTRPGARPVDVQEELDRVLPVVEQITKRLSIPISVDTSKAAVARAAIAAGAEIINDVTALRGDAQMLDVLCESGAAVCAMHMQGTPQTMQQNPHYENVVEDVLGFLGQLRDRLTSAGIPHSRVCLDPGIGFGKTVGHNLTLLQNAWRFHELGCPVLIGHSRKSFIARVIRDESADRTVASIGISCALAAQGIQILRVHDVRPVREALELFDVTSSPTLTLPTG